MSKLTLITPVFLIIFCSWALAQQRIELPCEGIFFSAPDYQSFEIRKDLTCIARHGFKPYNYEQSTCKLEYSNERNFWFINNIGAGEIKFSSDCSTMHLPIFSRTYKSVDSLPDFPSAPFPAPIDQMPESSLPANFSRLKNSTVKLGAGCSGTWLSNDGYFLTAMHCLHPELKYNGIVKAVSQPEATPSEARIGYTGIQTNNFKSIPLKPVPNEQVSLAIDGIADITPRLVALGPGSLYRRPYLMPDGKWNITDEQHARAMKLINEYVILKYNLGSHTPVSCSPIRTEPLIDEEPIWSNGFTRILNNKTHQYERLLVSSHGKAYGKISSVKMAAPFLMADAKQYDVMNSEDIVFSDARISPGMSGGPLTDIQGKIVGIVSFGIERNRFNNISEQSGFVRISNMYSELKSKLPSTELNRIFNCKDVVPKQSESVSCSTPEKIKFQILSTMERKERNFTQGFEFFRGAILESTGVYNNTPTKLNLLLPDGSQQVLSQKAQAGTFGEGLTVLSNNIYQATWQDRRMLVFDHNGSHKQTLNLPFNGWGLTNDGRHLILTDGSSTLRFLNPFDLSLAKELQIRMNNDFLFEVNELEWIKGKIFGNIFGTNNIVRINPSSGCVDGIMDATELISQLPDSEREYLQSDSNFVMNGIAFNPANEEIYLTGKNWKYLFTIKIQK